MSREIKFRAFDTEEKKMLNNVNPIFSETGELDFLILEHGFYGYDMCEMEVKSLYSSMLHDDLFIPVKLMQYTGLKDKNDVEIYEGDIAKISIDDGLIYLNETLATIEFDRGCFECKELEGLTYCLSEVQEIQVIGNVCENSELLN